MLPRQAADIFIRTPSTKQGGHDVLHRGHLAFSVFELNFQSCLGSLHVSKALQHFFIMRAEFLLGCTSFRS